jgi:hypothetical protein
MPSDGYALIELADVERGFPVADTSAKPDQRRLRLIEIAVLADSRELDDLCERLCSVLQAEAGPGSSPLPAALTSYDSGELPRRLQAELLSEIDDAADGEGFRSG